MLSEAADSAVLVGWFWAATHWDGTPPKTFLGSLLEGPSRIGHYFRPTYANVQGIREAASEGPVLLAGSGPHTWELDYDPTAHQGQGRIVVTLDGQIVSLDLRPDAHTREAGLSAYGGVPVGDGNALFDRFGMLSYQRGGHYVEVYLDDLRYTALAER